MCSNLSNRLEKLYLNMDFFIKTSIQKAQLYNYDGYMVDFEPDTQNLNQTKLTDFILEWNDALNIYNLTLNLWIGGNTMYDFRIYNTSNLLLTTMNTYNNDYDTFITTMIHLQVIMNNMTNLGFGLLTAYTNNYANYTNPIDITNIINWSLLTKTNSLSLWASHIDPHWVEALYLYINN
jgi:hypothetical protein